MQIKQSAEISTKFTVNRRAISVNVQLPHCLTAEYWHRHSCGEKEIEMIMHYFSPRVLWKMVVLLGQCPSVHAVQPGCNAGDSLVGNQKASVITIIQRELKRSPPVIPFSSPITFEHTNIPVECQFTLSVIRTRGVSKHKWLFAPVIPIHEISRDNWDSMTNITPNDPSIHTKTGDLSRIDVNKVGIFNNIFFVPIYHVTRLRANNELSVYIYCRRVVIGYDSDDNVLVRLKKYPSVKLGVIAEAFLLVSVAKTDSLSANN